MELRRWVRRCVTARADQSVSVAAVKCSGSSERPITRVRAMEMQAALQGMWE